jgi:hypothetical protein
VITVIAGTDAAHLPRDYPSNLRVTPAESGLPRETVFLGFQLRSLDHSRFTSPAVGTLPPSRLPDLAQTPAPHLGNLSGLMDANGKSCQKGREIPKPAPEAQRQRAPDAAATKKKTEHSEETILTNPYI